VIARRGALRERLIAFGDDAGANLAPLLREELRGVIGYYDELKRRAGKLDFLDLLLTARALVRDNGGVRAELQRRFERIFIDEFQDTDPLQAEILVLLAADDPAESDWLRVRPVAGKLFIVGDPKQSIYRFRRADVALYQSVKQRLTERGAAIEHLTVSFRATPALQEMVNAAFEPLMPAETATQAAYVPLAPFRGEHPGQPPVVVLPVPQPYSEYGRVTAWSIERSLPDAIAAMIRWLVEESGWTVTEREAPEVRVAIRPRHICVLFRRLSSFGRDVTRAYLRALEARHIAHVLVRGGSFNEREEIEALRNALGAVDRPDDELAVFASLRGPFFALLDDQLLEFRERVGHLHPFRKLPDGLPAQIAAVGDALGVLRDLTRGRNRRPIAETIARLLAATRAHAGVVIRPTGEQALANIMRLADHARRYEAQSGATSFRGFVEQLEERAERDEPGEVPIVEEGTEGVRIMTVHRAKGLEFPVVVLADITCNETAQEPSRYVDPAARLCALRLAGCAPGELHEHAVEEQRRDVEEAVRVLYVAATRARDLLVVPAVGDTEWDGWVAKLTPALYPDDKNRRTPLTRHRDGCPEFGDDSALTATRPPRAPAKFKAVAPGLHIPRAGNHRVLWWDPSRLILDVREAMGLRQVKLLQEDESHRISNRGIKLHEQWRALRDATIATASMPMMTVATVTEMAAAAPDAGGALADTIRIEEVARDPSRPHGARFGTLVHWTLLRTRLGADRAHLEQIVRSMARMLAASEDEAAAAVEAVANALGSPLLARAAAAPECRRECSLVLALDDGTVVEGIADLAFEERIDGAPHWTVVDFKTDLEIAPRLAQYRAQVALYVRALAQATGAPAAGSLLWI
ncbi:MAG: UvrD-helicase domain-containing protein, partial [Candidatus Binataceae bacterium]